MTTCLFTAVLLTCGGPPEQSADAPADPATQRQRDSAVARLPIPGAQAVDRALGVLEASEKRNAALDSIH